MYALHRWQPSIAKIGNQFYWTVWRFKTAGEWDQGIAIFALADGFTDNRAEAIDRVATILEENDPGAVNWWAGLNRFERRHKKLVEAFLQHHDRPRNWIAAFTAGAKYARILHKDRHATVRRSSATDATFSTERLWGWRGGDSEGEWFPVIKRTAKRVFVREPGLDGGRLSLCRNTLDETGRVVWRQRGYWIIFETEDRREQHLAERAKATLPDAIAQRVRSIAASEVELLGLPEVFDRDRVVLAFRDKALVHHPDQGGDAAVFRQLVAARDRVVKVFDSIQKTAAQ